MYMERLVAVRLSTHQEDMSLKYDIQQILQSTELEQRKPGILYLESFLKTDDKTLDFWEYVQVCKDLIGGNSKLSTAQFGKLVHFTYTISLSNCTLDWLIREPLNQ